MELIINHNSSQPIYEQIIGQIKDMIMTGELQLGDPITSVRVLAKELRIGVLTVQKAYDRLQREQVIESVVGKGTFVSDRNLARIEEEKDLLIEEKARDLIELSRRYGLSRAELIRFIELLYDQDEGEKEITDG